MNIKQQAQHIADIHQAIADGRDIEKMGKGSGEWYTIKHSVYAGRDCTGQIKVLITEMEE